MTHPARTRPTPRGPSVAKARPRELDDPRVTARRARLVYVRDDGPGIRRVETRGGFRFVAPSGRPASAADAARARALVIPPAWTDVWICPRANGHLQATGRDARGRKQYRYHPEFRARREASKYGRVAAFAEALPTIRRAVDAHLRTPGLGRDKVLATIVRLLEITLIRVGNEEYARENGSFGLTTLRERHVDVQGSTIRFAFRGKSGKEREVEVSDPRVARVVQRCHDLPGQALFRYLDGGGAVRTVEASDVNAFLRRVSGRQITAKDFRTWAGTVLAAWALRELAPFASVTEAKRQVVAAVRTVAARLGNTPAVCRRAYVHPAVVKAHFDGQLVQTLERRAEDVLRADLPRLSAAEAAVLVLIRERARTATRPRRRLPRAA